MFVNLQTYACNGRVASTRYVNDDSRAAGAGSSSGFSVDCIRETDVHGGRDVEAGKAGSEGGRRSGTQGMSRITGLHERTAAKRTSVALHKFHILTACASRTFLAP